MPRGKLQLKLIENPTKRISTYRRRIKGLKQKARELSTLCGVEGFVISYGPSGAVESWPENKQELRAAIQSHGTAAYGGLGTDDRSRNSDVPTVEALDLQLGKVRRRIEMLRNQNRDLDFGEEPLTDQLSADPQLPLELLSNDVGCTNLEEMIIMEDVGEEFSTDQFVRMKDVGCGGLAEVFMAGTGRAQASTEPYVQLTDFPQLAPEPILDVSDYPLFEGFPEYDVMQFSPFGPDPDSDQGISWLNSFELFGSEWPMDAIKFDDFEDVVNCWS